MKFPDEYMIPCLSKRVMGFECPGCGLQRAVALLFEGDFIAAFKMYPGIYPLMFLCVALIADYFFNVKGAQKWVIILSIASIVFILTNYILKFF